MVIRETFDNGGFRMRSSAWWDHFHVEDELLTRGGNGFVTSNQLK